MSDEGKAIQPEHIFKKFIWRSTLEVGEAMERFTTWTITGIAAVAALVVGNLDSVAKIVSLASVKTSIVLFTFSLLAGAISKQLGMAVTAGINTLRKTEGLLNSESGQQLMDQMTIAPKDLVKELAEPFFWPLSALMRKSAQGGLVDYVAADKRFVKLFCLQFIFNAAHGLLAIAAFFAIAVGIGGGE
jgi:hypothetical protein